MNNLIKKLKEGERVYGTAVISSSINWTEVIKQANLDFVFLDTEHIPLNRETLSNMCHLYSALGIAPMVRIPSPDPYAVCTVLDGGASAVLVPYVETVDQVKALVGAAKFRPLKGIKLQRILNGDETIDDNLKKYIDDRCMDNMLFINIESKPAVENLPGLLSVSGLDGVIIGPHDLSCSMGLPEEYNNPIFEKTVKQIIVECNRRDIGIGIHLSEEPEQQIKWSKLGVNIILHSSDISLFGKLLNGEVSIIKEGLAEKSDGTEYKPTTI